MAMAGVFSVHSGQSAGFWQRNWEIHTVPWTMWLVTFSLFCNGSVVCLWHTGGGFVKVWPNAVLLFGMP